MECEVCAVLESIRCDRIMKYVRLVEQMKRSKSSKQSNAKLQDAIENIRSEADEAWKRLAEHRRQHAAQGNPQRCRYCGSDAQLSDNGSPICDHCAVDVEKGRKPPEREESELKAKAATAG